MEIRSKYTGAEEKKGKKIGIRVLMLLVLIGGPMNELHICTYLLRKRKLTISF
jgi:hypothetical protein